MKTPESHYNKPQTFLPIFISLIDCPYLFIVKFGLRNSFLGFIAFGFLYIIRYWVRDAIRKYTKIRSINNNNAIRGISYICIFERSVTPLIVLGIVSFAMVDKLVAI